MNVVNAIAKVRFASAKPQRVSLDKSDELCTELICLEAGQELKVKSGDCVYYIVTGNGELTFGDKTEDLSPGCAASLGPKESHTIATSGETRLICIAVSKA